MNIYHYSGETGAYQHSGVADKSPLEENVWLVPALATTIEPPSVDEGYQAVFKNNAWTVELIPEEPVKEPKEQPVNPHDLLPEYVRNRMEEYPYVSELADALYWSNQGDNTKLDAYYAACAAVKSKYPKPEEL